MKNKFDVLINVIRGFCMALADSVPGVSGGTVAFILGFYDKFIMSINDIIYGNIKKKKEAIVFLIKLAIGWVIGMLLAILLLTSLFEKHIYDVSSLFLGFILFSFPIIIGEENKEIKGKYKNLIFTLMGIILVVLITYFNPIGSNGSGVDLSSINLSLILYVFFVGMIAISAMVLPGISGSTLLLIFGLYIPIMNAIKELLHFNFNYFPILMVFGFGVLFGIALVIKLLKKTLDNHRSKTIYLILGLMLGSIYAIIMGPTTLEIPMPSMDIESFSIIFFIFGGGIIFGLNKLKNILQNK